MPQAASYQQKLFSTVCAKLSSRQHHHSNGPKSTSKWAVETSVGMLLLFFNSCWVGFFWNFLGTTQVININTG
jgi:hypothetical protein